MHLVRRSTQTHFSYSPLAISRFASKAFTLLEIMMVVIIIGIMAALVVPRMAGQKTRAQKAKAMNEIDSLKTALKTFEMHVGRYPTSEEGLQALMEKPSDVNEQEWDGPYLDANEVPKDPWGNDYQYVSPGQNNKDFDLWSFGPDKQDGTEDDITNWTKKKS